MLALHFLLNVALLIAGAFVFLRYRAGSVLIEQPTGADWRAESTHPIREPGSLGSPIDFIAPVGGSTFEIAFERGFARAIRLRTLEVCIGIKPGAARG